jgi:hypothetical protein
MLKFQQISKGIQKEKRPMLQGFTLKPQPSLLVEGELFGLGAIAQSLPVPQRAKHHPKMPGIDPPLGRIEFSGHMGDQLRTVKV